LLNIPGLFELRNISIEYLTATPTESYSRAMHHTLQYLKDRGIANTFSGDAMLIWQVPFYSNGTVYCRSFNASDRNPDYIRPVTKAFFQNKPTALIDIYNSKFLNPKAPATGIDPSKIISIGNQFRVYLYPDQKLLDQLGFDMVNNR
jgi:hypothetical protein